MKYLSPNNRNLIICTRENLNDQFSNEISFKVVLISAWNKETINKTYWEKTIYGLIDQGVEYIVAIGKYSEELHDLVDDFLFWYDYENNTNNGINIITTFHDNESFKETIDFFIFSTEIKNYKNNYLLAILNKNSKNDVKLENIINKTCAKLES